MKENPIVDKSEAFSVRIVRMYKYLCDTKHEYTMSKQVLRSGTSIGANVHEAVRAQSTPDFYSKLNIALKEANETAYWIRVLYKTDYLDEKSFNSINKDCQEIISILVSITKHNRNGRNH